MADVFSQEERSDIMRQVRSKKNKSTELRLIEAFKRNGITGWRRNYPVKGHPDFVFLEQRVAVFVDGCFWHGHDCSRGHRPASRQEYWEAKIDRNVARDVDRIERLRADGWQVLVVWECETFKRDTEALSVRLRSFLG